MHGRCLFKFHRPLVPVETYLLAPEFHQELTGLKAYIVKHEVGYISSKVLNLDANYGRLQF